MFTRSALNNKVIYGYCIRLPLLLISIVSISASVLFAQDRKIKFEPITVEHGLSQSSIYSVIQDSKGFLWFGTQDGLNKYDGYNFTVYKSDIEDTNSLSHNVVLTLSEDTTGNDRMLWIGTEAGGVNSLDLTTNTIKHYTHDPSDSSSISSNLAAFIHVDKHGSVWVITDGGVLQRLDKKSGKFIKYINNPKDFSSISDNRLVNVRVNNILLVSFFEDSDGDIWIGTEKGLNRYIRKSDSFQRYLHNPNDENSISNNIIVSINETKSDPGVLWICTWGGGLNKFDKKKNQFIHYHHNALNPASLADDRVGVVFEDSYGFLWVSGYSGLDVLDKNTNKFNHYHYYTLESSSPAGNNLLPIYEDGNNDIWFISGRGGLERFNHKTKRFTIHQHDPGNPNSLGWNLIDSYCVDKTGVLWLGTDGGGVSKYVAEKNYFELYRHDPENANSLAGKMVRAVLVDRHNDIWVGYAGWGLDRINRSTGKYTHFRASPNNKNSLSNDNVWSICEDHSGNIWIATLFGGLNKLTIRNRGIPGKENITIKHYVHNYNDPNSISTNILRTVIEDQKGYLWIGTDNEGLERFDPKTERFKHFTAGNRKDKETTSISSNIVRTIIESKFNPGIFWIGTDKGVDRFDANKEIFKNYTRNTQNENSMSNSRVLCLYEDNSGIIWIGTYGGGLNRFDPKTKIFTHYTEKDGLPNNVVYAILEDELGNLWLSTNNGLSKYTQGKEGSPKRAWFINYDVHDGLQSNEFNGGSYFRSSSDEMFFGGVNGLNSFFPDSIKVNTYPPEVVITDFRISNQPVEVGPAGQSPLQHSISETKEIFLSYQQNIISFEFVALHYVNPSKNKYAFMLEGFEKEWRYTTANRRFADYTNLSPGKYIFKVKASNNNDVWNEKGASIKIVISPPWWKTFWAYAGFIFIIVAGFVLINKTQRSRIINKEREEAQIREAELRARAAEAEALALKAENDRKTHELEEARKLQLSMLPKNIPVIPNLDIAVYMKTASEVGGDYYDFHVNKDGSLIATVGDATGHGLRAGTMVSVIKGLFCANISDMSMKDFFEKTTGTIKQFHLWNMYMGLTLAKIKGNHLTLAAAGMPPIYIYRAQKRIVEEIKLKGMPLGAFDNFPYTEKQTDIAAGDTIFMLSDGLPELFNESKDMYEYKRTKQAFEEVAEKSPDEIIEHLISGIEKWSNNGAPNDDITFLIIKVKEI